MRFKRLLMTGALIALSSASQTFAQEQPQQPRAPRTNGDVVVEETITVARPRTRSGEEDIVTIAPGGLNTFVFLSSEMSFDQKVVKGAPYSAEATTEMVQTLSDGNRIVRKNSTTIYRDGEGRTRREQTLGMIGQWGAAGDPPKTIFINDPVARVNFILEPKTKTARKLSMPRFEFNGQQRFEFGQKFEVPAPPPNGPQPGVRVFENAPVGGERTEMPKPKVESLGRRNIEGVDAEGKRTTITIPAGHIGNERPIEIVTERWYSPELQTVVLSIRKDPMAGETTYKLTNINRAEPARSLFEVPGDYTIKDRPQIPPVRVMGRPRNEN